MKKNISDGNIIQSFIENARINPGRAAIVFHDKKNGDAAISYGTLLDEVEQTAAKLLRRGIKKGDRVVVFIPMSPDLYRTVLALFYIGAVAVFIDAWGSVERINQACETARPAGFIGTPRAHLLRLFSRLRKIPVSIMEPPLFTFGRGGKPQGKPSHPDTATDDAEALITFTTGSTGRPKAARRTHGFLRLQHQALSRSLSLSDDDVDLTTLPIFLLNNLALGITSVIPRFNPARPGNIAPPLIIDQIRRLGITSSAGSPAFYEGLAEHIIKSGERVSLRKLFVGGAPVYSANARMFRDAFPGADITAVYGSTEAEPISKLPIESILNADVMEGLPVGKIVRGLEVRIIRPVDGPVEPSGKKGLREFLVKKGETGEIIIQGPHVLREYLNSPDEFCLNKIIDGDKIWHRTGDAGKSGSRGVPALLRQG